MVIEIVVRLHKVLKTAQTQPGPCHFYQNGGKFDARNIKNDLHDAQGHILRLKTHVKKLI